MEDVGEDFQDDRWQQTSQPANNNECKERGVQWNQVQLLLLVLVQVLWGPWSSHGQGSLFNTEMDTRTPYLTRVTPYLTLVMPYLTWGVSRQCGTGHRHRQRHRA